MLNHKDTKSRRGKKRLTLRDTLVDYIINKLKYLISLWLSGSKGVKMIKELDLVVLTRDIEKHSLKSGDVGTVVHCYEDNIGYEIEFVTFCAFMQV